MTGSLDTTHDRFNLSSLEGEERPVVMSKLYDLHAGKSEKYWPILDTLGSLSSQDIDSMINRPLPKISNGKITYKVRDILGDDPNKILERTSLSFAKVEGKKLLDAIQHIHKEDPDVLSDILKEMYDKSVVDLIVSLKMIGAEESLIEAACQELNNPHTVVMSAGSIRDDFMDSEYYPMENRFRRLTQELVSSYVQKKIKILEKDKSSIQSDAKFLPILEFASQYSLNDQALKDINLKTPLPQSLFTIHRDAKKSLQGIITSDLSLADELLETQTHFPELSKSEKLVFAQKYLDLLSKSYAVFPPPSVEYKDNMGGVASQVPWSEERIECFQHPLGRINLSSDCAFDNFPEFLEALGHEFVHGLEDLSILSLNNEFKEQADLNNVQIGQPYLQKNIESLGLLASFNTNADMGFTGKRGGKYYKLADSEDDYCQQLRERHAYKLEKIIASATLETLDKIKHYQSPLNAFTESKDLIRSVHKVLEEDINIGLKDPKWQEGFKEHVKEMNKHFDISSDDKLSDLERLSALKNGSNQAMYLFKKSVGYELISDSRMEHVDTVYQNLRNIVQDIDVSISMESKKAKKSERNPNYILV